MIGIGLVGMMLAGLGVWWLTTPVPRFHFETEDPPPAAVVHRPPPQRDAGAVPLLWLAGIPLPARLFWPLRVVVGGVLGLLVLLLDHALPAAIIVGLIGYHIPPGLLRLLGRARWRQADRDAYALANTMRYVLPVEGHPLTALRRLVPDLTEPLRGWMTAALAQEATGAGVEHALQDLAQRLHHTELGLLAEILRADRHEKPAADLLGELIDAWTERIEADDQRLATLAGGRRLVNILVGGPVVVFCLLPVLSPGTGGIFTQSVAGQAIGAVGLALFGAAAWLARVTLSKEEAV
jgi:Flp pilus assembly protein TadB